MKKIFSYCNKFRHWAYLVALTTLLSANAFGQQSRQMPQQSESAEASDRGLPTITNIRQDARQPSSQDPQRARRSTQVDRQARVESSNDSKDTFGTYVQGVTGVPLQVFGKNLFTDVPLTFSPFESSQVNGDYVIGTGDELQIRGWGMITVDLTTTVDRSGAIYVPKVGTVKVAGVKYRDLQAYLKQAIGKTFTNFDLTVSISQTRALQIYVVGHAVRPGTYTLNSMSTLLNALFTSGGPDATGSMRNIELKRGNGTVTMFDLYDVLAKGDKSKDETLRDGDVIYIPEVGPLVALTGNVKTPAIFETKGRTSLADLIGWAGGVDSAAEKKNIIIEKTVDNSYTRVAELVGDSGDISQKLTGIMVSPADVIRVFSPDAVPIQANSQVEFVRISGEVKQPGVFQLRKGETLRELMFRIGGTTDAGYLFATQVKRDSVKRSQQARLDELADRFERTIDEAAKSRLASTTDKDVLTIQVAEQERQRRVAQQMRSVKSEGRIVLELDGADAALKNLPDLPLQDGDSIFVPRKPGTVEVIGAVFQNNSFIFKQNRTVQDYLLLAGGATDSADTSEIYLVRADGTAQSGRNSGWFNGVRSLKINPGDTIVVPEKIERGSWRQAIKEWTAIFYQFGLGAAGLKVLKN